MSEGGYIQGAGDDSEGWASGLTPDVFWANKSALLSAGEDDLPDLIAELLAQRRRQDSSREEQATPIKPTANIYIGKNQSVGAATTSFDLVIDCHGDPDSVQGKKRLNLGCIPGKLGSRNLRKVLGKVETFVSSLLDKDSSQSVVVVCDTGRDLSVGVALMILCSLYDDAGMFCLFPLYLV